MIEAHILTNFNPLLLRCPTFRLAVTGRTGWKGDFASIDMYLHGGYKDPTNDG